jgi:hypothetical protein
MFLHVVCLRNYLHCLLGSNLITLINYYSLQGRNIAVKYTIYISAYTKFFNANN